MHLKHVASGLAIDCTCCTLSSLRALRVLMMYDSSWFFAISRSFFRWSSLKKYSSSATLSPLSVSFMLIMPKNSALTSRLTTRGRNTCTHPLPACTLTDLQLRTVLMSATVTESRTCCGTLIFFIFGALVELVAVVEFDAASSAAAPASSVVFSAGAARTRHLQAQNRLFR